MDDARPLFVVVAESVEAAIIDGSLPEGGQVPSTNELAVFHRVNPATAAKGVGELAAAGTIYKRRGIGMFVADGARSRLIDRRREQFTQRFIAPLAAEADLIGMSAVDVVEAVRAELAGRQREGSWTPSSSRQ